MKTLDIYVHSDRDDVWNKGEELGLEDDVLQMFSHACCEVKLTVDVDLETGIATITHVDDRKVLD